MIVTNTAATAFMNITILMAVTNGKEQIMKQWKASYMIHGKMTTQLVIADTVSEARNNIYQQTGIWTLNVWENEDDEHKSI